MGMEDEHRFTVGQRCEGNQGIGFEVVSLDPLRVKCIEARILPNWSHGPGSKFTLGNVYTLKATDVVVQGKRWFNFVDEDFGKPAPWVSLIEDGHIAVH